MDWDHVARMWKQAKGKIQEKWGKLTDDDLELIGGRRDRLEGKIQQRYGFAPDHVRKENRIQASRFLNRCCASGLRFESILLVHALQNVYQHNRSKADVSRFDQLVRSVPDAEMPPFRRCRVRATKRPPDFSPIASPIMRSSFG